VLLIGRFCMSSIAILWDGASPHRQIGPLTTAMRQQKFVNVKVSSGGTAFINVNGSQSHTSCDRFS
jgi:hypothetical protein